MTTRAAAIIPAEKLSVMFGKTESLNLKVKSCGVFNFTLLTSNVDITLGE